MGIEFDIPFPCIKASRNTTCWLFYCKVLIENMIALYPKELKAEDDKKVMIRLQNEPIHII
jgi:hypothetical protein